MIVGMIPWPEIGSNSGHWPHLYSFCLSHVIILSLDIVKFWLPDIGFIMLHTIHKSLEERLSN